MYFALCGLPPSRVGRDDCCGVSADFAVGLVDSVTIWAVGAALSAGFSADGAVFGVAGCDAVPALSLARV